MHFYSLIIITKLLAVFGGKFSEDAKYVNYNFSDPKANYIQISANLTLDYAPNLSFSYKETDAFRLVLTSEVKVGHDSVVPNKEEVFRIRAAFSNLKSQKRHLKVRYLDSLTGNLRNFKFKVK